MASPTQWTWIWVDSGSWWWTGRPGVLQFMGSQRVGHDWATELNWVVKNPAASTEDLRDESSIPGLGRSRRGGYDNPPQHSCLENPMDRGAWQAVVHRSAKRKCESDFYWFWVNPGIDWSGFRVICVFLVRGTFTRIQACVANWCQHLLHAGSAIVSDAIISGEIVLLNIENDRGKYHTWNIQNRKTVSLLF